MSSVFLSYSRTNLEHAEQISGELTNRGLTVWRDQDQLCAGKRWPKALGEAIAASDVIVLLWSIDASRSDYVELEWTTALALKKQVIPFSLDETALPSSLAAVHMIAAGTVSEAADKILAAVSSQPPPAPETNTQRVMNQLNAINDKNPANVLKQVRTIHGSIYKAGHDINIATAPQPTKTLLEKWEACVAIVAGILTVASLAPGIWHNYASSGVLHHKMIQTIEAQRFAGCIWTPANDPLAGVKVSLMFDGKLLDTRTTDKLGRFDFRVTAPRDADVTLVAQKDASRRKSDMQAWVIPTSTSR